MTRNAAERDPTSSYLLLTGTTLIPLHNCISSDPIDDLEDPMPELCLDTEHCAELLGFITESREIRYAAQSRFEKVVFAGGACRKLEEDVEMRCVVVV